MHRIRGRLTYSNVISTLCLVLLLGGGTAYAASQLGKESVGTRQLKREAVTPAKLSKAAKATLTGPTGPKGDAGAQGPQGIQGDKGDATTTKPTCAAGTQPFAGLCFESSARPSMDLAEAVFTCSEEGRWLPSISQLLAFEEHNLTSQPPPEWTESISEAAGSTQETGYIATASITQGALLAPVLATQSHPFRCVVGPNY